MTASDETGGNTVGDEPGDEGPMQDPMMSEAIGWLLRQRGDAMTSEDWESFTLWLEADVRHAQAFDRIVAADDAVERGLALTAAIEKAAPGADDAHSSRAAAAEAANDNPRTKWASWAVASAAAVVLAVLIWPSQSPVSVTRIATAPGEVRQVALSDTITMTLNGASAVELTDGAPYVTLESGEVVFAITSDQPSPLRVAVDGLVLTDIGTEFSVTLSETDVRVAVADGIIAVNPEGENVQVPAGQAIEKARGETTLVRREIDPELVASWREGRLEFYDTPLARALAAVKRSAGVTIEAAPRLADARLTGSVRIDTPPEELVRSFAEFAGGTARRVEGKAQVWIIE
ncbi:MAG: FecR domain-containing protein [Pseudomonadota bacterium]